MFKESFPDGRDEFPTYLSETMWAVFQYCVLNKESDLSDTSVQTLFAFSYIIDLLPYMSVLHVLTLHTACLCCSSDSSDGARVRKRCGVWDELSDAGHTLHCEGLCCEGLGQECSHDNWVYHWWEWIPIHLFVSILTAELLIYWTKLNLNDHHEYS